MYIHEFSVLLNKCVLRVSFYNTDDHPHWQRSSTNTRRIRIRSWSYRRKFTTSIVRFGYRTVSGLRRTNVRRSYTVFSAERRGRDVFTVDGQKLGVQFSSLSRLTLWRPDAWRFEGKKGRTKGCSSRRRCRLPCYQWSHSLFISETYTNGMPPSLCVCSVVSRRVHKTAWFSAVFRFVFFFFLLYYQIVVIVYFPLLVVRVSVSNAADKPTKDVREIRSFSPLFLKRGIPVEPCTHDVQFPSRFVRLKNNRWENAIEAVRRHVTLKYSRHEIFLKRPTSLRLSDASGYWSANFPITVLGSRYDGCFFV